MFSTLRTRFGIPGVISTIALVFAMTGGAFAAKYLITSTNQIKPSVLKKLKGAAGPAGAAGAQGAQGAAGANGTNGTNGTDGTSAKTKAFVGVKGSCTEGGIEVESASPVALVCNGKKGTNGTNGTNGTDGSPWVVGTAPQGVLLKGTWAIQGKYEAAATSENIPVPISTGVPIDPDPLATGIPTVYLPPGPADPSNSSGCTGTAAQPKAELAENNPNGGAVCLYASAATNLKGPSGLAGPTNLGKSGGGVVPLLRPNDPDPLDPSLFPVSGHGTWALITPIEP